MIPVFLRSVAAQVRKRRLLGIMPRLRPVHWSQRLSAQKLRELEQLMYRRELEGMK